jgi:anthranilate phosphoribosyltransferase
VLGEVGVTYANAAALHPGFRHAGPTRREIGISTLFNVLGPLCNPARPEASAVGAADLDRVPLIVGVFQTRGATALVYRGDDGIDKLTTTGHSHVWEVTAGSVQEHDLDPAELGLPRASTDDIVGGTPEENAAVIRSVFAGERGPARDIVVLNAAAGLTAYDLWRRPEERFVPLRERLAQHLRVAEGVVDSGAAAAKLAAWVDATHA